jgi:predicted methyltransferase
MRLTDLVHDYLARQLHADDLAIDATAGNGYDTEKMAQLVGPSGRVIAIDLQASAIAISTQRLRAANLLSRCQLHTADHASTLQSLLVEHASQVNAIAFNLGYLPKGDKSIRTHFESTRAALDASSQLLKAGGLLLVTAYRGHDGGQREADTVAHWMRQVESRGWCIESHEPIVPGPRIPPILWVARR